jgi:hypothetical protein
MAILSMKKNTVIEPPISWKNFQKSGYNLIFYYPKTKAETAVNVCCSHLTLDNSQDVLPDPQVCCSHLTVDNSQGVHPDPRVLFSPYCEQ